MTFCYRYQDKERGVLESEIAASSQSDAYSLLRKSGIRPMSVWPKPGLINRLSALGKRGTAIIVLSALCLVLGAIVFANRTSFNRTIEQSNNRTITSSLPRQQVPPVDVEFRFVSERTLAAFARPGDTSGLASMSNTAAVLLADLDEAVLHPVPVDAADGADAERLKRIVNGMKLEIGISLRCGDTKDVILARLIERQKMEAAYRERAVENVRRHHDALQSCNETLRVMSLAEITQEEL